MSLNLTAKYIVLWLAAALVIVLVVLSTVNSCSCRPTPQPGPGPDPVPGPPAPGPTPKPGPKPKPKPQPAGTVNMTISRVQAVDKLWSGRRRHARRIQVAGIEGPTDQYAAQARQFAESLLSAGRDVTVAVKSETKNVIIGDVTLQGGQDLAQAIVKAGWAKVTGADLVLRALEVEARLNMRGIWQKKNAMLSDIVGASIEPVIADWGPEPE